MLDFLITFGIMSLIMSVVIIFLLIMRGPMRKRFTAYCRYIIWAVVIIRLCIPVSFGFLPTLISVPMTERTETDVIIHDASPAVSVPDTPLQIQPETTVNDIVTEPEPQTNTHEPQVSIPTPDPTPEFRLTEDMAVKGITAIWLIGAVGFIVVTLVKYLINIRKLTCDLTEPTAELNEIYLSVCEDMGLTRHPLLYINKAASSPMVCGFLRPRVLLPEIELSEDNLRYIIRHELIHYKRGDLWFKLLSMVANAIHWFNPMVYIACGVFADETELSCDEKVLGKTELKARLDYGNSMLEIVRNCRIAPNLTTGFNPKKKAVKQRFENIIDTAKKRKGILIIISVIIVALIATSIIGCSDTRRYDAVPSLEYANGLANDDFRAYVFENKVFPVYGDKSSEEWKLYYEDEKLTKEELNSLDTIWNSFNREEIDSKTIVVRDGSGSMLDNNPVSANSVATSLTLLFAERLSGEFKNKFITFASNPRLVEVKGNTIKEKYDCLSKYTDYTSTCIEKVYNLILKVYAKPNFTKEDQLDRIVIISDMEFDYAVESDSSTFELFKEKFAKMGYKLPEVVFWNVRARSTHLPVTMDENNVKLVSGSSASIIEMITKNSADTPYDMMLKCLEKYSCFDSIIIK